MADEKYSDLSDGGGLAAADEFAVARSGSSVRVTPIGVPVLVYRYTVTGSDKASIDTGVDTANAGSNDWTNGDLLEAYLYARTDETANNSQINFTLNNDAGNNYDVTRTQNNAGTLAGAVSNTRANWFCSVAGASAIANSFGIVKIVIPNFAGSVGFKIAEMLMYVGDANNNLMQDFAALYHSTSAVTRLAVTPNTAGKKLKVGSQLLIYKRLSS